MTDWTPATEAEVAMRDALRGGDQEQYFRILARIELLLPVSSNQPGDPATVGWGTWTTGQRTHVLAFTSTESMRACLAEHAGGTRELSYRELAAAWPNLEWWLAVNPGLPIEGYLPAWFVSQLARGDVRLPGRTAGTRARVERAETLGRARVAVPAVHRPAVEPAPEPPSRSEPPPPRPPSSRSEPLSPAPAGPPEAPSALERSGPPEQVRRWAEAADEHWDLATDLEPDPTGFIPANDLEERLLAANRSGGIGAYLSALLLAKVLLPVAEGADPAVRPGESGFVWRTEDLDGQPHVVVFTSPGQLAAHLAAPVESLGVRFVQLIRAWPDVSWSLAVNPGTPVAASLPGTQITSLVSSAAEVGLGDDAGEAGETGADTADPAAQITVRGGHQAVVMRKVVAPGQVGWYLDRGYDRVSGFVHREQEVTHLRTPAALAAALGLHYQGSPFDAGTDEVYVLRWPAHRHSLYRIPYGGRTEAAMTAMEGWVIERAPFRGNGFAPADNGDVIAEFKVDSIRLPHGAELWRLGADGSSDLVASLDADGPMWRKVTPG